MENQAFALFRLALRLGTLGSNSWGGIGIHANTQALVSAATICVVVKVEGLSQPSDWDPAQFKLQLDGTFRISIRGMAAMAGED